MRHTCVEGTNNDGSRAPAARADKKLCQLALLHVALFGRCHYSATRWLWPGIPLLTRDRKQLSRSRGWLAASTPSISGLEQSDRRAEATVGRLVVELLNLGGLGHGDLAQSVAEMNRLDTLLWELSATADDLGPLTDLVRKSDAVPHQPVTVETLIADGAAPLNVLGERLSNVEMRTVGLVSLVRVNDERGAFVLACWPTQHDDVFHLISSVPSTDPRWQKVERWVGNASPCLVPCFLDHEDFSDIGTALFEHGNVEVSRLTARRRKDLSSLTRGWQQQSGTLRPNHLQAISDTEDDGASVRTLTLHVSYGGQPVVNLHLRRLAGATFYNGDFELFDTVVLRRLAVGAARRADLLTGRERKIAEPLPAPIAIKLPGPILADADATGDVIALLEEGTALAVAVLHRNPYLHVVVTDNTDGSNFDVVVTEEDAIEVYPGFRASMGALSRLTQMLGERFEAWSISDAGELVASV